MMNGMTISGIGAMNAQAMGMITMWTNPGS